MYSRGTRPPTTASTNSKPAPRSQRLDLDARDTELAAAARLPHEAAFGLRRLADRLLVRDLRPADVRVDAELALHAVDDDVEVQLAHAGDDRLARLRVELHAEARVFFGELLQRLAHPVLVVLRLRLDGDVDHRLGEA